MSKAEVYQKERMKLFELFRNIEPSKALLVEGLIEDAAFLLAENYELRGIIGKAGMVKFHPHHSDIQRTTEAAKQYLRNVNSYAVVIKTLNGVLHKGTMEGEEDMSEFE